MTHPRLHRLDVGTGRDQQRRQIVPQIMEAERLRQSLDLAAGGLPPATCTSPTPTSLTPAAAACSNFRPGSEAQVELPFTGLNVPAGVAVDTAGSVYITNADVSNNPSNSRVLKLPAGTNAPVDLPFTGLNHPDGVAADTAGNVYITDSRHNRVFKLPAG